MNAELNLRVFRRNKRNIILIWNSEALIKEQLDNIAVEIEEGGIFKPLKFSTFSPHDINKFTKQVCGIVINQVDNALDVNRFCNIKVILGKENRASKLISVLPFAQANIAEKESKVSVFLHAWDPDKGSWQKLCGEHDDEGKFRLLMK